MISEHSVVKSRLQAGSNEYKSSLHGLLAILRQEGFFGLYKGITSKIIQSVLTAAILFASQRRIFELTKKVLVFLSSLDSQLNDYTPGYNSCQVKRVGTI